MLREDRNQCVARHASCRLATARHRLPLLLVLAFVAQLATGCSVGMALHGQDEPNLAVLQVGATKPQIEAELYSPASEVTLPDGRTQCTYFFTAGNESSAGRAALHAGMDILTFGVWELVGTPIEAVQGQDMQAVVVYDATGKAETFNVTKRTGGTAPAKASPKAPPKGGSHS